MITLFDNFIKEEMDVLPVPKYPVDKCTHVYDIAETLEKKYGIDVHNLQPGVPTKHPYHDFNFYDFLHDKIQYDYTFFPKVRFAEVFKSYDYLMDAGSVMLLPKYYDAAKDAENYAKKKDEQRKKLIATFGKMYKGKKLEDMISAMDKHVDFGTVNYDWVNIALEKIYEEYKDLYKNNFLRIWEPFDNDTGNYFEDNKDENTRYGYPIRKMLFLSDIEKYLKSNYDVEDELFYQYIVDNNYIEGRYWERRLHLKMEKDKKFSRYGGKYGMDATKNIDTILSIMEHEFKDMIDEFYIPGEGKYHYYGSFDIYVDYFKKITLKD